MKKKNPLYVVTNSGKDVEMVKNFLEAIIKKLNLEPLIKILQNIFALLLENIKSYPMLVEVNKFLELYLNPLLAFLKAKA